MFLFSFTVIIEEGKKAYLCNRLIKDKDGRTKKNDSCN